MRSGREFDPLNRKARVDMTVTRRRHLEKLATLILWLGIAGVVLSAALITLVTVLMHRIVVVPLRRLLAAVTAVGLGQLSTRVPPEGVAEIGALKRGFNSMADTLEAQRGHADRYKASLESLAARLQRANAELDQFASVASHDLREPLRKIRSFGSLLSRRFAAELPEEAADYIERMSLAADRMETLIEGVLDLSRATRLEGRFELVSLNRVVGDVLDDLQVLMEERRARVEVGDLPELEADALQMRQLFQNLIGNALKFCRPGVVPVIAVRGRVDQGVVELTVTDNGIGFEEAHGERIFGPFQRLHGRSEYPGTGLGLALCRRIAERHGGTIVAQSTLGAGASFTVRIPATRPLAEAA